MLKVLFAPFLPFSSQKLHEYLGYETPLFGEPYTETVHDDLGKHTALRLRPQEKTWWAPEELVPGTPFQKPKPLFRKLEPAIAEEERARLGN